MTSSQWLDLAILAVASSPPSPAGVPGRWARCCHSSVWCWAVAGVLLAPHVVSHINGPRTKLFALFLILSLVVIGEIAGVVLGRAVRGAIRNRALHC